MQHAPAVQQFWLEQSTMVWSICCLNRVALLCAKWHDAFTNMFQRNQINVSWMHIMTSRMGDGIWCETKEWGRTNRDFIMQQDLLIHIHKINFVWFQGLLVTTFVCSILVLMASVLHYHIVLVCYLCAALLGVSWFTLICWLQLRSRCCSLRTIFSINDATTSFWFCIFSIQPKHEKHRVADGMLKLLPGT